MIGFEPTESGGERSITWQKSRVVGSSPFFVGKLRDMPYKPKHPCSFPRCPELVPAGERFCTKHKKQEQKRYDEQRGTAAQRGYDTRWKKYRRWYLQRYPLCVNYDECHNVATVVVHRISLSKGGDFWDSNNHQPICKSCHDRKTAKEDGRWG